MEHIFLFWMLCCIPKIHAQTWSLGCYVHGSATTCPPIACDGDQVTLALTADQVQGYVAWMFPVGTCQNKNTANTIVLSTTRNSCRHEMGTCGPFNATNIDPGSGFPCFQSNVTVIMNSSLAGLLIKYGTQPLESDIVLGGNTTIYARARNECHTPVYRSSLSIPSSPMLHSSMSFSAGTIEASPHNSSDSTVETFSSQISGSTVESQIPHISGSTLESIPDMDSSNSNIMWITIGVVFGIIIIIIIGLCLICYYCINGRHGKQDAEERVGTPQSKSGTPQSHQKQLAKKIRNINQLNGLKYKGKPILQTINTHWKELAPKLSIDPSDIRETAKSMCGRALISQWLKKPENPTWGELIKALKSTEPLKSVGQSVEKEILKKNQ